jgi:four helix bundle protein
VTDLMAFSFEKLDVYKRIVEFVGTVYKLTRDFPSSEVYGLTSQIRRASVSVPSNIAEGSGRYHKKDFTHFLRIARGSLYECVPLFQIAYKETFIEKQVYEELMSDCHELAKMINGLIKSLKD